MNTKIKIINLITVIAFFAGCKNAEPNVRYLNDDGIMVEILEEVANGNEKDYNSDNRIYTEGKIFNLKYHFEDASGAQFLYHQMTPDGGLTKAERKKTYFLVPSRDSTYDVTQELRLKVIGGPSPFGDDYNQSIIKYDFFQRSGIQQQQETTGLIENLENIWIHPPRIGMFSILEINPFPFVKFPLEIGKKWQWTLNIGDGWGNSKWREWEGSITNNYNYQIIDKVNIESSLGKMDCYVIDGVATSRIGQTYLKSYFNETYGFVKLEYTNIDSSKTIIELENVSN